MTSPAEQRPVNGIQVIARAAEILRAIQSKPGGLTQAEIADQLGLARTTVHRILNALEQEGFVASPGQRGRYRLGPEIPRMADAGRRGLVDQVHPFLVELSRLLNETVDLSMLDRDRVTFLDQVVAPRTLRAVSAVGDSFPLHCTAPGKAILAGLSATQVTMLVGGSLTALTSHSVTSMTALRAQLLTARDAGVAYDREEHHEGISAVGCTLVDPTGSPIAISVPVPTQRFAGRENDIAAELLRCRARIVDAWEDRPVPDRAPEL